MIKVLTQICNAIIVPIALFTINICYARSNGKPQTNKAGLKLAKELVTIVKNNSIYADSIDWDVTYKELDSLSQQVKSKDDIVILANYLITQLRKVGDKHSFLQSMTNAKTYATRNSVIDQPFGKLLDGGVGYLFVPAFTSISDTASLNYAQRIQTMIRDLESTEAVKGWIVDLRKNGGGNMYPMIAGLGPVMSEGVLGYFISKGSNSKASSEWFYKNGSSGVNNYNSITVKNSYKIKSDDAKVAVLIGSGTASSGEMTAISFSGRANTKLFGEPTAGFVTANRGFKLSNGAYLYLATSYVADRNKKTYKVNIEPDTITVTANEVADTTLEKALQWIKTN